MSALRAATVRDALDSAVIAITASGSATPRLDAELLLAHALGVERTALFLDPDREVGGGPARAFQALVRRRSVERAPIAYLLGRQAFRRIELAVDPRVLVPRPETELLVEVALERPAGARVLDVGTGSGAIALAVKDERPDVDVAGIDVSAQALAVARANAARLGLDVALAEGDLLTPIAPEAAAFPPDEAGPGGAGCAGGALARPDAVLSNPPYVAEGDPLPPDVMRHEPLEALLAGDDGLAVIRRLVPAAAASTTLLLALEVGAGQAGPVAELARAGGFAHVAIRRDLAGIPRVVVATR